jgi:hypothetical protein
MSRNKCFFSRFGYHMFYFLNPFVTYLLTPPRTMASSDLTGFAAARRSYFDVNLGSVSMDYGISFLSPRHTFAEYLCIIAYTVM